MKKILAVLLACILLTACSTASDVSLETIEKSGYFIAGYNADNYHTYGGYGLAIDIIKHAGDRMGFSAPIYPVNSYDWQTHLANQTIDVMLCENSLDDLQTVELFNDQIVMISRDDTKITKIGLMDSKSCIEAKNNLKNQNYEFIYYSDSTLLLNDLEINIIDSAIISEYEINLLSNISDYSIENLNLLPVTFVVLKDNLTFYNALNSILAQMVDDGTIERLKLESKAVSN